MKVPEPYAIVLVNLEPTIGSEIRKTRPCVVVSPREMNEHLRTVVVVPVTSASKGYPTRVPIAHPKVTGSMAIDQIRTTDTRRIIRVLGKLAPREITRCKAVLREAFVD